MRVLILSCGTGGGHNAAASAMKEALEARGHSAEVLNPYTLKTNKLAKVIDIVYVRLVQISPTLFGCVYKIGDAYRRLPWRSPVYFVNAQMVPVMDKYLKENKYDAILMPHLFPAEMVTQMKAKGIDLPPTIFVATDYVCTPFTEETNCDAYVIPSRHVRYDFLRRGIPEEKIKSLGIPVRREFAKKVSKEEARKELGLEENTFYLLVSAGSMGAGGIVKTIKLLHRWCKKQNKKLEKKRKNENENCVILTGFTKQMALYLKASDVCITKPGGLSSTEAAVANIPFIHAMAIPGCETRNLEFFESCGMSIGVKKSKGQLIRAVNRIQGKELCETMKLAQRKFVRPDSGMAICRLTEKMVRDRQNINL